MSLPSAVVVDANILIALCAREADKLIAAESAFHVTPIEVLISLLPAF